MVDAQVRGKTFKGPSACAQAVYKELSKHRDGKKKEGRTFDLPAQGSIRNYVSNNAERLDITWQSKQPKDCTK